MFWNTSQMYVKYFYWKDIKLQLPVQFSICNVFEQDFPIFFRFAKKVSKVTVKLRSLYIIIYSEKHVRFS